VGCLRRCGADCIQACGQIWIDPGELVARVEVGFVDDALLERAVELEVGEGLDQDSP